RPHNSRHWLGSSSRPTEAHLSGRSCRTVRKSGRPDLPSLWHTTLSAAFEHYLGLLDSPQSPGSRCFQCCPCTKVPFLLDRYSSLRYYAPVRHPPRPAPDCRGSAVEVLAPPRWACRVDSLFLCTHTITNAPVAPDTARVARFAPGLRPSP